MIVKNEALVIERILNAARQFCDELIVVDTGSDDDTVVLAEGMGASVYHFDWVDDFAAARNFAFDKATHPWVIWLDADDVIDEENIEKLKGLKEQLNDEFESVVCDYQIVFDNNGNCVQSIPRERLIRHSAGGQWELPVHETYMFKGKNHYLSRLDIKIKHQKPDEYVERSSTRNLDMLENNLKKLDAKPVLYYYLGKEQRHHDMVDKAQESFSAFIESGSGEGQPIQYQAMHQKMLCEIEMDEHETALQTGLSAIGENSARAEAYVDMGVIYYRQKLFLEAIPLLTAATVCARPSSGMVMEEYYNWKPWHYLSLCYEGAGLYQAAIKSAKQAMLTIPDKKVVEDNIRLFESKLAGNVN